ncbi:hypothetical protein KUCAC02_000334 [Chaenocephalus aceratus]|uniref:Uncharacterized protein n=1 Tax=Chaenocephalus aceratus TaxID=36190 RepID=A0ACB9W5J6_CHAAC|nr:hypothetical protein KUCAC02_000334 [Chaenocephalus aceratus]
MTAALDCFDMERRERDLAVTFSITVQYGKGNSPFAAFPCNPPARLPTNPYAPPSTPSSTSSAFASRDPGAVKHYYPGVLSSEYSPPGTEASGWLACLAAGPSPATTSTWPEFNPRGRLQ